ncbi:Harbinger transposase-derived nuclease domain [Phytophthora cactorum]|nr:Harbinger transposase-derived nuclease domain [Phytophthora cactorum]
MLLVVMKCGGTWDMLARIFRIKTPTFITTITGSLRLLPPSYTSNRPSGPMVEAMPFYSAKHKLYGFIVEVSVNPRGLAVNCTVIHLAIRRTSQCSATTKHSTNPLAVKLTVTTVLLTMAHWRQTIRRNGRFWRTKDIKVSETMFAAFTPKGQSTHPEDRRQNELISSDRVIVENCFGRMCGLWRICARNSAGVNRFMTTLPNMREPY